ncbi:DUF2589 domain-containing protein [Bacteroides fluxus]|jgi:hypothetical protein
MSEVKNNTSDGPSGNDKPKHGDGSNIVLEKMRGLPMRELIVGPLLAAAEAQQELASTAWDFYQRIAFYGPDEKKLPIIDGKQASAGDTRILQFKVKRPVQEVDHMKMVDQEIQAPFIGLVPIPSLLIDRIVVDFQMEVTNTGTSNTKTAAEVSTNVSSNWFVKASISGKGSTSHENTRSTNQTAKYQVHVSASQQPHTEGLSKLMDIMVSCIEPISVKLESDVCESSK